MSVRLIVPVTGLTGSVAGIVGLGGISSGSFLTTNQIANVTPSFTRKLQSIDSVEVSYSCSGNDLRSGGHTKRSELSQ